MMRLSDSAAGDEFMKPNLTATGTALLLSGFYAGVCAAGGSSVHGAMPATAAPGITMHQNVEFPATPHEIRWDQRPLSEDALKQLAHLRAEGLVLQKLDGGKLSHAHRDYLQQKLDAIYQSAR
jgi:hypothetical protein